MIAVSPMDPITVNKSYFQRLSLLSPNVLTPPTEKEQISGAVLEATFEGTECKDLHISGFFYTHLYRSI